jgi:hypothetical protein
VSLLLKMLFRNLLTLLVSSLPVKLKFAVSVSIPLYLGLMTVCKSVNGINTESFTEIAIFLLIFGQIN